MQRKSEGEIELRFPDTARVRKFDDPLPPRGDMKAVDFIVEFPDRIVFIEVKDPQASNAPAARSQEFVSDFTHERKDTPLYQKFRDSFLYEWASGRTKKPVHYWILVACDELSGLELQQREDALTRKLPTREYSPAEWRRHFAESCSVFNLESWNRIMPGGCRVARQPAAATPAP